MKLLILLCYLAGALAWKSHKIPWDPAVCCYPVPQECCPQPCPECLDVAFIVDDSGSLSMAQFADVIQFLQDFAAAFTIGPNDFQTAMVQFNSLPTLLWNFGAHGSNADLMNAIAGMTQTGGFTNTIAALNMVTNDVIGSAGDRNQCNNTCVVLTDGLSQSLPGTLAPAADALRAACGVVYAVGVIVNVPDDELEDFEAELLTIAGSEATKIQVDDFPALKQGLETLVAKICEDYAPESADGCCPYDSRFYKPYW